ncbi:DNA-binding protein [Shewanella baltica]|uniref:DNA-binding protein n=1 Tax=Shewanella baltica TaxID=62322 RepID=UPI003D7B15DA
MTKEWFSTVEIAELLDVGDRRVRDRAKHENWQKQRRQGLGGGFEYHLNSLPLEARQKLAKQEAEQIAKSPSSLMRAGSAVAKLQMPAVSQTEKAKSIQQFINLPDKAQKRADAKMLIVNAKAKFCMPYLEVRKLVDGEKAFCEAYVKRSIALPEWVFSVISSVSVVTIRRWENVLTKEGVSALAGKYKVERPCLLNDEPDLADFLKGLITAKPHLAGKAKQLRKLAEIYAIKTDMPWQIPSISSIRRWVNKWISQNQAAFTFTTNPKKFNDKYRTAVEQTYSWMAAPNDVWEFDSTPVDAMLKEGRHTIIAVIDCFTRRVKLLVSPTSSSEGICLLMRKTLLAWGVPNQGGLMRTDNGSDYVSQRTTSIYHLLDLEQSRANPYSGWEKPFIERFFKTLSHDLIELLPGYIGHNVNDREAIEARKEFAVRLKERNKKENEKADYDLRMTQPELQQLLDNWVDAYYHLRAHDGLKGKTPNEVYRAAQYQVRAVEHPEALDLLLNHVGEYTILKGFIKAGGLRYTAPEMLEHEWKGQRVRVFLDPTDVARAFIYPINNWETRIEAVDSRLLGQEISPAAYRQTKKEEAKALRSFRAEMKQLAKTFNIGEIHQTVIEHYAKQAQSLVEFPTQPIAHQNPSLMALTEAAEQLVKTNKPGYSDQQIEHLRQKRKAIEERKNNINQQHATLVRNEHEKARLLAAESLNRELTPKEDAFLKDYKKHNKLGAKRIDEIMGHKRRATN